MDKIYIGTDVGGSIIKSFTIYNGEERFQDKDNSVLKHDGYVNTSDYVVDESDPTTQLDLNVKIVNNPKGQFKLNVSKLTDEINNNRWLLGTLAKAVSTNSTKVQLGRGKMRQHQYYLNIIGSIVLDMKENGLKSADVTLGVLLPAKQFFDLEKEMITELLSSNIEVKNNLTGEIFNIRIREENIIIKPEAVVAFTSVFIGKDGKITDLGKTFAPKFNIVIDIGENTTDIAAVRQGKPDPLTFHSFDYAGSLLMQYFEREIYRKFEGYQPTAEELRSTYSKGTITLGVYEEWVGEEISQANEEFARRLFQDFTQIYLLGKDIKLPQIAAFMFIGGGSIKIDKVLSVGEHFMNLVKEECKYVSSFSPDEIRLANIHGLAEVVRQEKRKQELGR